MYKNGITSDELRLQYSNSSKPRGYDLVDQLFINLEVCYILIVTMKTRVVFVHPLKDFMCISLNLKTFWQAANIQLLGDMWLDGHSFVHHYPKQK